MNTTTTTTEPLPEDDSDRAAIERMRPCHEWYYTGPRELVTPAVHTTAYNSDGRYAEDHATVRLRVDFARKTTARPHLEIIIRDTAWCIPLPVIAAVLTGIPFSEIEDLQCGSTCSTSADQSATPSTTLDQPTTSNAASNNTPPEPAPNLSPNSSAEATPSKSPPSSARRTARPKYSEKETTRSSADCVQSAPRNQTGTTAPNQPTQSPPSESTADGPDQKNDDDAFASFFKPIIA